MDKIHIRFTPDDLFTNMGTMEHVRYVEVHYYRNGKHVSSDVNQSLVKDHEGNYFVLLNEGHRHPVNGVQLQPALKAGWVKIY